MRSLVTFFRHDYLFCYGHKVFAGLHLGRGAGWAPEKNLTHRILWYAFHTGLRFDADEPFSLQPVVVIDISKVCSLIPVWLTLTFFPGHSVWRNLELMQSFCCKLAWSSAFFYNSWICKGDDCKGALESGWICIILAYVLVYARLKIFLLLFFICVCVCVCVCVCDFHMIIRKE